MDDNTIERVIPLMLSVLTVQKKHIIPPLFSKKASVFKFLWEGNHVQETWKVYEKIVQGGTSSFSRL